ncbi:MAG: MFS transporter [Syntrophomonadaceae bacterium]|nr:MFS transporter [Syntrophomonadaceae bacterium]
MGKLELKWRVFLIIAVGILISTLDSSILNIANPSIAREFGVELQDIQWVVNAYLLVITSTLIFFGRLGDLDGSNRIFTWGFMVFALGSLGCSLSRSLMILVGMRILQGLGASMMMATGIGIVSNIFPDAERGKALGLTGTMVALGNMLGPGIGGLLLASFKWPVIFLINIPIGIAGFYLGYRYLPNEEKEGEKSSFDLPGALILATVVTALLLALSGDGLDLYLLGASLLGLIALCWWERRAPAPLLDFGLFRNRTFVVGNLVAVVAYSTHNSVVFLLPFYLEAIQGLSPASSGLIMTTAPIVMAFAAPLAGHLSDRYGSPPITGMSLGLLAGAFALFSFLRVDSPIFFIMAALAVMGLAMGSFGSPNTSSILGSMPKEKAGYGGGFISTNRNLSYSLGISLSVLFFNLVFDRRSITFDYQTAFMDALHTVQTGAGILVAVTGLLWVAYHLGRRRSREPIPERDTI